MSFPFHLSAPLDSPSIGSPSITFELTPATPDRDCRPTPSPGMRSPLAVGARRPPLVRASASLTQISIALAKRVPSPSNRSPYPARMCKAPTSVSSSGSSEGMLADAEDRIDAVVRRTSVGQLITITAATSVETSPAHSTMGPAGSSAVAASWHEWRAAQKLAKALALRDGGKRSSSTSKRAHAKRRMLRTKKRDCLTIATETDKQDELSMKLTRSALRSLEHWTAPPPLLIVRAQGMERQSSVDTVSTFRDDDSSEEHALSSPGLSTLGSSNDSTLVDDELDGLLMEQLRLYAAFKGDWMRSGWDGAPRSAEIELLEKAVAKAGPTDAQQQLRHSIGLLLVYAIQQAQLVLTARYHELGLWPTTWSVEATRHISLAPLAALAHPLASLGGGSLRSHEF